MKRTMYIAVLTLIITTQALLGMEEIPFKEVPGFPHLK